MDAPEFRVVATERGDGVTYDCGCPCQPTAVPGAVEAGFEHCCCGKVHFAGPGATAALTIYLDERARRRKHEPGYARGSTTVLLATGLTEVAWAFPSQPLGEGRV